MMDSTSTSISVRPIVHYPRVAEPGKSYLMTVDLRPLLEGTSWPFDEEEYPVTCILDTEPLFSHKPIGQPDVVMHRFGGSYGAAKFLLTASEEELKGEIRITLMNRGGIPVDSIEISGIEVIRETRAGQARPVLIPLRDQPSHHQLKTDYQTTSASLNDRSIVGTDSTLVAERYWNSCGVAHPPADLIRTTQEYLGYLVASHRYLNFRGMGMTDRVPMRLPLLEMYVPLKARIERPDGETWTRYLRLAGRKLSTEEAEATGQRVSEPMPVLDLLKQHDGLIVLGDPGAGKTTFLKYLALLLTLGREAELGLPPHLPVLVPISAYASALAATDVPFARFIGDYYRDRSIDLPLGPMLDQALAVGKALLLLDGLDEVKEVARRQDVVNRVVDFCTKQRQRGNRFILTSRIVGYDQVVPRAIKGLVECTLVDFGDEDIALYIKKWSQAIEQTAQVPGPVAAQAVERERSELMVAMERNPGVRRLAANPLLLTVLALMKRQGMRLPERRVVLYGQYVDILLRQWNLARSLGRTPEYSPDVKQVLKVLAPLALWMQETSPGVGLVKEQEARRKLVEIYRTAGVDDPERASELFLADVREHANLLVERGSRQYGFIHLTFQEYLAAVAIAQQAQRSVDPVVATLGVRVGDDNWREVSLLAVAHLGIVQDRAEAASAVLLRLIEEQPGPPGAAVALAGQALLETGEMDATPVCREAVIAALNASMGSQALPVQRRLDAGIILSELGIDPQDLDEFISAPDWAFAIGRYPITNAQFRRFIQAGGYDQERKWWSKRIVEEITRWAGNSWPSEPRYWGNRRLNHHTQPVVGVSWYEANAYCAWLTEMLQQQGVIDASQVVRLPTIKEWQQAAGEHRYPWGDEFDPSRANSKEGGLEQTTPVHMYPAGATPEGVWDMAGNVWEWTADVHHGRSPWLVGGSWRNGADRVGSDADERDSPFGWDCYGFRVILTPASPNSHRLVEIIEAGDAASPILKHEQMLELARLNPELARQKLTEWIVQPISYERWEPAVDVLSELDLGAAKSALTDALRSPESELRWNAAARLAGIADSECWQALQAAFENEPDVALRGYLYELLSHEEANHSFLLTKHWLRFIEAIEADDEAYQRAARIVESLHDRLSRITGLRDVYRRTSLFGSMARRTAIRPTTDIDALVLLDLNPEVEKPGDAYQLLEKALKHIYKGKVLEKSTPRASQRMERFHSSFGASVVVDTGEAWLEVLPAVSTLDQRTNRTRVMVPDKHLRIWVPTNHGIHKAVTNELDKTTNGQYRALVKAVKWWQYHLSPQRKYLTGFMLECLVAQLMKPARGMPLEVFASFLESVESRYSKPRSLTYVQELGVASGRKATRLLDADHGYFINLIRFSVAVSRAAAVTSDLAQAVNLWQQIFGSEFPARLVP